MELWQTHPYYARKISRKQYRHAILSAKLRYDQKRRCYPGGRATPSFGDWVSGRLDKLRLSPAAKNFLSSFCQPDAHALHALAQRRGLNLHVIGNVGAVVPETRSDKKVTVTIATSNNRQRFTQTRSIVEHWLGIDFFRNG